MNLLKIVSREEWLVARKDLLAKHESVFQIELGNLVSELPEVWGFPGSMDDYGALGALANMKTFPGGGNNTLVYFPYEDCAVEVHRVTAAGGRIQIDKFALPHNYGFAALALDTEGNMFGLHSMQ